MKDELKDQEKEGCVLVVTKQSAFVKAFPGKSCKKQTDEEASFYMLHTEHTAKNPFTAQRHTETDMFT